MFESMIEHWTHLSYVSAFS